MNFIKYNFPEDWDIEGWIMDSTMEVDNART